MNDDRRGACDTTNQDDNRRSGRGDEGISSVGERTGRSHEANEVYQAPGFNTKDPYEMNRVAAIKTYCILVSVALAEMGEPVSA